MPSLYILSHIINDFMAESINNKPLTSKEERFCYEYLANRFNGTKACELAGYKPTSARVIAARLLAKVNIQTKIQHLKDNLAETSGISALMIANEHAKIAFSNIAHLHNTWIDRKELEELTDDQKSCIQEVSTKVVKQNVGSREEPIMADVEYIRIKTYDKQKSLDSLNDMLGYKSAIKQDITMNATFTDLMKKVAERRRNNG